MRDPRAIVELLRHGEPVGGQRVRGKVDDPLSDAGWEQMHRAVSERDAWSHIITSPLQRCAAFAGDLAERTGTPLSVEEGLAEIDFGEWEGQTPAVLWSQAPDRVRSFFADPIQNPPPGGEPFAVFQNRVADAWRRIADDAEGRLLIVAHGGTIRVILGEVLGISPSNLFRMEVGYACLSQLAVYHDDGNEGARSIVLRSHL